MKPPVADASEAGWAGPAPGHVKKRRETGHKGRGGWCGVGNAVPAWGTPGFASARAASLLVLQPLRSPSTSQKRLERLIGSKRILHSANRPRARNSHLLNPDSKLRSKSTRHRPAGNWCLSHWIGRVVAWGNEKILEHQSKKRKYDET